MTTIDKSPLEVARDLLARNFKFQLPAALAKDIDSEFPREIANGLSVDELVPEYAKRRPRNYRAAQIALLERFRESLHNLTPYDKNGNEKTTRAAIGQAVDEALETINSAAARPAEAA